MFRFTEFSLCVKVRGELAYLCRTEGSCCDDPCYMCLSSLPGHLRLDSDSAIRTKDLGIRVDVMAASIA